MNRLFNQFFNSLERGKVVLFAKVAIGAVGAPTVNAVKSKGVASVAKNSAGNYTITLNDIYVDLYSCDVKFLGATDPGVAYVYTVSQAVNSTKAIVVQCKDISGLAVDPASGSEMQIEIKLKSSTAP
jgi:hypothetical protein